MMNFPPHEPPQRVAWSPNGRPGPIHVTLDLYHRLSIALTTDPRYPKDEVVRLLREDELLVDTLSKSVSRKGTGEVVGTFQVFEEDREVEYVELNEADPLPGADHFE
jgi:hypothetical protein